MRTVITLTGKEDGKVMECSISMEEKPSDIEIEKLYENMLFIGKGFTDKLWIFWEMYDFREEMNIDEFKEIIKERYEH